MNRRPHELLAGAIVCVLAALLMGWGFSPHRHIHAKAWVQLPPDLQSAWGGDPTVLVRHATSADARKHTDTLEPPRHYLDLDDVLDALPELSSSTELEGMGWQDYRIMVTSIDSTLDPRRFGVLPWQLFWTYRKLVALMAPTDSTPVALDDVLRTAADLGHYLADAHVPLHTTGNYNGQRTNQTGIHALWETHNVEHLLASNTCDLTEALPDYGPLWTPWDILHKSHEDVRLVLAAEAEWRRLTQVRGWALRRRGRTLAMLPSPEALNCWDSLTGHRTWPRFCETSHLVASAWVSAWHDAGTPSLRQAGPPREPGMLYLLKTWIHERFRAHSFVGPLSWRVPCRLEPRLPRRTHPTGTSCGTQNVSCQPLEMEDARRCGNLGPRIARHTSTRRSPHHRHVRPRTTQRLVARHLAWRQVRGYVSRKPADVSVVPHRQRSPSWA